MIPYSQKINARPIGSEPHIILEPHIVGIVGVATILANNIKLVEVPLQESPSSVIISGYTETVNPTPGVGFFYVDYINGYVTFNASANGIPVQVTYYGRGSEIDAVDVNELQGPVGVALNYNGSLTPGIVKPSSISTTITDNFTFPNNVNVNGDLTVLGTTTTIESQTVTFEDPVLLLNYNNPTPITTAGIEVLRDGTSLTITSASNPTQLLVNNTAGISTGYVITQGPVVTTVTNVAGPNALDVVSTTGFTIGVAFYHPTVKFVWDESLSAWQADGTIIGHKNNATALRVKGLQSPSEGVATVQSYSGIFYDNSYSDNGLLKTRFISGGNVEMDVEVQSPNALLLTAASGENPAGFVGIHSYTDVVINARTTADTNSICQLKIDRVDTSTQGTGNVSDVNLNVNAGNLRIMAGNTTGALIVPILTTTQRNALTPVNGMIIYNSTTNTLQFYNGSSWLEDSISFHLNGDNSPLSTSGGSLTNTGNLTVNGQVNTDLIAGRTAALVLQPFADSTTAIALKNAAGGSSIVVVDTTNLRVGINTTPVATLHNAGSTVVGLDTASDPASIIASQVNSFSGIKISTTVAVALTLPTPTNATLGRLFSVLHAAGSTGTLNIDGQNVGVGKGVTYTWDGSVWTPVGSSGGAQVIAGNPVSPVIGDFWFNSLVGQYMGYNGTSNVILG